MDYVLGERGGCDVGWGWVGGVGVLAAAGGWVSVVEGAERGVVLDVYAAASGRFCLQYGVMSTGWHWWELVKSGQFGHLSSMHQLLVSPIKVPYKESLDFSAVDIRFTKNNVIIPLE